MQIHPLIKNSWIKKGAIKIYFIIKALSNSIDFLTGDSSASPSLILDAKG